MELRFLGQSYYSSRLVVETIPSDIKARFMGQTYIMRRPIRNFKPQLGLKKYRAVTYYK